MWQSKDPFVVEVKPHAGVKRETITYTPMPGSRTMHVNPVGPACVLLALCGTGYSVFRLRRRGYRSLAALHDPETAGVLGESLGLRDRKLVAAVDPALAELLRDERADLGTWSPRQRQALRVAVSRGTASTGLTLAAIQAYRRSATAEDVLVIQRLARASRVAEVRDAASECLKRIAQQMAAGEDADTLLRASEPLPADASELLRAAGPGEPEAHPETLLRPGDGPT